MISGSLPGVSSGEATAWRIVFVVLAVAAALSPSERRRRLLAQLRRIVRSPRLVLIVCLGAGILWLQLWVFVWAPANHRTQDVALGYFLLPLVMVLVGRVFFGDRLTGWQRAAVVLAAAGVAAELIMTRSIGWPVLLVAGLYPVYFGLRRWFDLDRLEVFLLETTLLLVPSIALILIGATGPAAVDRGATWLPLLVMAALSGVAMLLYILASQLLTLGLFGLLGYVEPVLLLAAAVVLGERLAPADALVYGPIALALALLGIGTWRAAGRRDGERRRRS
ncbi:EamA family transporter RarD [Mycetocola reblochoni]|uniref:Protein rarD n=1 Tax=Mycetocola reblochoni REB411 TaxID=1255698 RepID=A0A1R4JE11_9MICO|nr:EamA family transporter RarD [Mycetocola reblochoni]SJN30277.1 Protein rarD [Mycetocola reblochoni REB411]